MPSISNCKCVLVIGSTSGIGRALALAILGLPSKPTVVVCGRRKERLEELVAAHHATGRLKSVTLDVLSERNALKSSIEEIVNTYPNVCGPCTVPRKPADWLVSLTLSCSRMAFNVASISRSQKPLISTVCLSCCAIVIY
jgi:NAD(P)-dependent dehydrogenase (short-subunit alcohol dehydrogenase family)